MRVRTLRRKQDTRDILKETLEVLKEYRTLLTLLRQQREEQPGLLEETGNDQMDRVLRLINLFSKAFKGSLNKP